MKKIIAVALLSVALLASGCDKNSESEVTSNLNCDKSTAIEYQYLEDFDNISGIFEYSTNIVKAKLFSIEPFDGSYYVFKYRVETDYTKNTETYIHVYDAACEKLIVDESYYLFLEVKTHPLYPHKIYTTVLKNVVFNAADTATEFAIKGEVFSLKGTEMDDIIKKAIEKDLVADKINTSQFLVTSATNSIDDAAKKAEVIIDMKILKEYPENKYVSLYKIEKIGTVKGDDRELSNLLQLKPGLKRNISYRVFLKRTPEGGGFMIFDRNYQAVEGVSDS